jgi:MFS family permease
MDPMTAAPSAPISASDFSPRQRLLSLTAVISGALAVGLGIGALIPLMVLRLEARGVDSWLIGGNGAMVPLAVLLIGPLLPRIIGRLGTMRSMYFGFVLFSAVVLLLPTTDSLLAWYLLRFLSGAAIGVHWVVTETWMNMMATNRNRGRVMAVYVTMMSGGFALGPLVISGTGIDGTAPFLAIFAAMCVSMVPIVAARRVAPTMPPHQSGGLRNVLTLAPLVMAAALFGGMMDLAVVNMLPLYGLDAGFGTDQAALMLTIFVAGNVALQIPLGWLADRLSKRTVLLFCTASSLLGALLLPLAIDAGPLLWVHLFLWGGVLFAIYTVTLGLLGDSFAPAQLATANTALIMFYNIGSASGPIIAGGAMDLWSRDGLVATIAVAAALLIAIALRRRGTRRS